MKTHHARLIRCGILTARHPELSQYVDLAPRLMRWAARREAIKIYHRNFVKEARAEQAEHIRRFYA